MQPSGKAVSLAQKQIENDVSMIGGKIWLTWPPPIVVFIIWTEFIESKCMGNSLIFGFLVNRRILWNLSGNQILRPEKIKSALKPFRRASKI